MKISLNWLKEFINFKLTPEKLAYKLSMSTVEVESILDFSKKFKGIVVGEIKEIKKHPLADKLFIAKIDIGAKKIQAIYSPLFKINVGDKVPVASSPVTLPTGLKIERSQIRGIDSQGMICSDKELDIFYSKEGFTRFSSKIKAGTPLVDALGIKDVVLDLDVLSNRADLFSHFGVARELGAILNQKVKPLKIEVKETGRQNITDFLEVEVKDKVLCPRYQARVITDVKVEESPDWLKNRLTVLGIRPVNNVVDITNYVMVEQGQPLHAFDFEKIESMKNQGLKTKDQKKKIIIRKAKTGEEIETLDEKQRKLSKEVLVIADTKKPIAIAGIMGGKNTEVDEETHTIVLESANFNWVSIRKTQRMVGLRTDSALRYEKNLDDNLTTKALNKAAQLISKIANGKVAKGKIDLNFSKFKSPKISLDIEIVNRYLGRKVSLAEIEKILSLLGMEVLKTKDKIEVIPPTFRRDIKEEADLIEEIARISGYDKIPTTSPVGIIAPPEKNKDFEAEIRIKNTLKGLGVLELYNYSFIGEELLRKFFETSKNYFRLKNYLSPEHELLRKNLIFSMIKNAEGNAKNFDEFLTFEIAKTFKESGLKLPLEKKKISVLAYGKKEPFYVLKGILEALFGELSVKNVSFKPSLHKEAYWHPQKTADINFGNEISGVVGELNPEVLAKFNFKNKLAVSEIDFSLLLAKKEEKILKPFSRFPKIVLDIAVVVDEKILEADLRNEIVKSGKGLVTEVELFDIYKGHQIGEGKKSLAYHLTYQSLKKTLTDEEVSSVHQAIINSLSKKFNAQIRSS